ncbi:MAG: BMP family ABC transporter substrate-binding protein [Blautia sp.]|nr:BMP family ABC transporter substrate-binding protein [Blautia sp.]MDY5032544.1 BMP family ABC transporter substrate-binding protein [Blautia sp.]
MSLEDYNKAHKLGKRDYQSRLMRGEKPTLEVLDDILPSKGSCSEVSLGLVQIPIDQIVGTKTEGRSNAFAGNFMPILDSRSEFGEKWTKLSIIHEEEGIRDPIKAYEYMNRFYVEEGNKRVSVLKYFGAVSIPGIVTRIIPPKTEEKENKIYFEFLDFYEKTKINYIWFSQLGSFQRLLKAVKGNTEDLWDDDDRMLFSSQYNRFTAEYEANGGNKLSITPGDAFLAFIRLYGYQELENKTVREMKELIIKSWEEFKLLEAGKEVTLKMEPSQEKKSILSRLIPTGMSRIKIGFIYTKTPMSSAWIYMHELGRMHIEQKFPDEVSTCCFENITEEIADTVLESAIQQGCKIIFTTSPSLAKASVKAAIAHPEVHILNCSLNTSHRYIRTYYARMHEAKFLMGAVAGAMAENDRITYVEDYPIYGSIANINAFALGAKMVNPRAKIYLEWTSRKDTDVYESIRQVQPSCISGKDMVIPEEQSRLFGVYHVEGDRKHNIAMPLVHWGKFYEKLIRNILDGTWKYDDKQPEKKAINYWWGMSSGVVDIICSNNLPIGTKRLVELLRKDIASDDFYPFAGVLYSQNGIITRDPCSRLTAEEIVTMDWLAENVIGSIPKKDELQEAARPVVKQQGVKTSKEG